MRCSAARPRRRRRAPRPPRRRPGSPGRRQPLLPVVRRTATMSSEPDAEQRCGFADALASGRGGVDGGERGRRVEVVVEGGPRVVEAAEPGPAARHRSSRAAAAGMHVVGPLPAGPVVVGQDRQTDGVRLPLLQQVARRTPGCRGDFDIFVPSRLTIPTCIQWRTNGSPVAASDWAASHSWCGKIRSRPAAVQVDGGAELAQREGRALDVPARPARPPEATPRTARRRADGCHSTKSSGSRLFGSSGLPPRSAARASIVSRS